MSHFVGIVVGKNLPTQLQKYNENTSVLPYKTGDVSEEAKIRFLKYYQEKYAVSANTPLERVYAKYGDDWNGRNWVLNQSGVWEEWSTYNPDSKWDWYEVGGRWDGYFLLKNGKRANVCRKGEVDTEGMMKESYNRAIAHYNLVASCFPDNKIPRVDLKWNDDEAWKPYNCPDSDAKRAIYWTRPPLLALQEARESKRLTKEQQDCLIWVDLEDYNDHTAESYATKVSRASIVPYCLVEKGEWYQKGRMGWFGMSFDESTNWDEQFHAIWNKIHGNTTVTAVDFHI